MKTQKELCVLLVVLLSLIGCSSVPNRVVEIQIPNTCVSSDSIDDDGNLVAEVLLDSSINVLKGHNESPHVVWEPVEGAVYYAVCMFDTNASWLHWIALNIEGTELRQGEYTSRDDYIGPYPPRDSGFHYYRIEVFALREAVDGRVKLNSKQAYGDIENLLDTSASGEGNIIARGNVVGKHKN